MSSRRHQGVLCGLAFAGAFACSFAVGGAACSASHPDESGGVSADAASNAACQLCVTDTDCDGGVCAQLGGDSYCVTPCDADGGEGAACRRADDTCSAVTTVDGMQATVCVPAPSSPSACGAGATTPPTTSAPPPTSTCGTLVGPDVTAPCRSCGSRPCQANGCYGGWWCNTANSRCQSPPSGSQCASGDGGALHVDASAPVGTITANGGSVSRLYFAVVGDTRPPAINDTPGYPTRIIDTIYTDIDQSTPKPSFVVSTGDYVFASPNGSNAAAQFDLYLAARNRFAGVVFPALGNHECTGAVTSNCGAGNADGQTQNYTAFLQRLLAPIGKTSPNYVIEVNASDGSWTSKLVFIAGNAWSAGEESWLEAALSKPTTYTFIVRHEPKNAYQAPGCAASEPIMARHPYTLAIVGHTHTYGRTGKRQVTMGNGGAPLVSGTNYGYGIIQQRSDGDIQVDMIDYATGQPDMGFRFALHPDGSDAP